MVQRVSEFAYRKVGSEQDCYSPVGTASRQHEIMAFMPIYLDRALEIVI